MSDDSYTEVLPRILLCVTRFPFTVFSLAEENQNNLPRALLIGDSISGSTPQGLRDRSRRYDCKLKRLGKIEPSHPFSHHGF
jgi:hypothetical protein